MDSARSRHPHSNPLVLEKLVKSPTQNFERILVPHTHRQLSEGSWADRTQPLVIYQISGGKTNPDNQGSRVLSAEEYKKTHKLLEDEIRNNVQDEYLDKEWDFENELVRLVTECGKTYDDMFTQFVSVIKPSYAQYQQLLSIYTDGKSRLDSNANKSHECLEELNEIYQNECEKFQRQESYLKEVLSENQEIVNEVIKLQTANQNLNTELVNLKTNAEQDKQLLHDKEDELALKNIEIQNLNAQLQEVEESYTNIQI